MATVVDAFIVTLGLDPKDFTAGQKQAANSVLRMRGDMDRLRREMEQQHKQIGAAFKGSTNQILAFGAAIIGAGSIAEFTRQTVRLDANVGRLAHNLNSTTEEVSAWEGAVRQMGGTTDDADRSLQSLVNTFTTFQINPGAVQQQIGMLQLLGMNIADLANPTSALLKLADRFHGMNPAQANWIGQALGLSPAMINLLEKGRGAVLDYLGASERAYTITRGDAEAAQAAQRNVSLLADAWRRLGNDILNDALPPLTDLAKQMTVFAETDTGIRDMIKSIGDLSGAMQGLDKGLGGNVVGRAIHNQLAGAAHLIEAISHAASALGALLRGDWRAAGAEAAAAGGELMAQERSLLWPLEDAWAWMGGHVGSAPPHPAAPGHPAAPPPADHPAATQRGAAPLSSTALAVYDYLTKRGMDAQHALGVAAGVSAEGGEPGVRDQYDKRGRYAFGIEQLRGPRQRELFRRYGRSPTFAQELDNLWRELHGGDAGGAAVLGAKGADAALRAYVEKFMRPAGGVAGDLRRGADFIRRVQITVNGGIKIYTQATDAKGIASDLHGGIELAALGNRGLV